MYLNMFFQGHPQKKGVNPALQRNRIKLVGHTSFLDLPIGGRQRNTGKYGPSWVQTQEWYHS